MPNRLAWVQHTFNFDFPIELFPELIERLRGTPARVEELARSLPPDLLKKRDGETWSIQENIGHLADLEQLFSGRLDDYDAAADTLRPADMTNRKTHESDHNARAIEDVLNEFRTLRRQLIERLDALQPQGFARVAMHPRLQVPMRVVDMISFHAQHDDYHLARMRELVRRFTQTAAPGRIP